LEKIKSSADYVRLTRAALAAAGLVRMEREGMVWWETGQRVEKMGARVILSGVRRHRLRFPIRLPQRLNMRIRKRRRLPPHSTSGPGPSLDARDDKRALVLIHGVNDNAGTWFTVAPALAQRFRLILPDLPGHGESEPKNGALPIPMLVDSLEKILPEEPFTLLGNSLGGWLAMHYTLRHPERVQTLILESSGGLSRPFAIPLQATSRENAAEILRAVHGPEFQPADWAIDALLERAQDSPMLRIAETESSYLDARLGELQTPTHLIWGADDGILPLAYAEELQRGIPGAQLHVLEKAAHIPHLQQPQRFLECLTAIC
jgi:pimeloyl-ACP methyl ester carboxylesterase